MTNIDLIAAVGKYVATQRTFTVNVPGSVLTIVFSNQIEQAKISAIEVRASNPGAPISVPIAIPTPTKSPAAGPGTAVALIRCGGGQYTDSLNQVWLSDRFFSGGSVFCTTNPIADTIFDPLYQCERWGPSTYSIPVNPGRYTVTLHLSEITYVLDHGKVRPFGLNPALDVMHSNYPAFLRNHVSPTAVRTHPTIASLPSLLPGRP
jgi:hypothetical protein